MEISSQDITAILHFRSDLSLVDDSSSSQVLTGEGTDHFSSIFSYGLHERFPLEVWIEFKFQSTFEGRCFPMGIPDTAIDESD